MAEENNATDDTTKAGMLGREVATSRRNIYIDRFSGLLRPTDETLIERGHGRGLKIYDEVERDPHIYAVLQKRKMAVVAREFEVKAASEDALDKAAAELVEENLRAISFDRICLELLDAILKGFAVGEVMWEINDGRLWIADVKKRDQRRFIFDDEENLRLLTWENMLKGEELPAQKFVVHRFNPRDSDPYGLGLGHRLFWYAWFKRQGVAFWLTFCEKFGAPTTVGEYPAGQDHLRDAVLEAAAAVSSETAVAIPTGTVLTLLEAQRGGNGLTYDQLCRYTDEQASECVLGETLTTNIGKVGSKAAASTHDDVREELTDADADLLSDTLEETFIKWLVDVNFPGARCPRVRRIKEEDLSEEAALEKWRAEIVETYNNAGYSIPQHLVDKWYAEELVRLPIAFSGTGSEPVPAFSESDESLATSPEREATDALVDQLERALGEETDQLVGLVHDAVFAASDADDLTRRLLEIEADPTRRRDVIARAMILADLTGQDSDDQET